MAKKRKTKKVVPQEEEEEVVDYAAGADAFAGNLVDSQDDDDDDDEQEGNQQDSSSSEDEHPKNSEESSSDDDSEDESHENKNEAGDDNDDEEEESDDEEEPREFERPKSANGEPCTFDLRNLMAMNAHQINTKTLYSTSTKGRAESVTIPAMQVLANITVDEEELMEKATDGCTQLIAALWQLPKERSSAGPMVLLPSTDESRIPRALVCQICLLVSRPCP